MVAGMETPTETARKQLASRPRWMTYERIASETGLGRDWLSKLAQGDIRDAGAARISTLSDYLESAQP